MKTRPKHIRAGFSGFLATACALLLGCGPGAVSTGSGGAGSGGGTGASASTSSGGSSTTSGTGQPGALVPHVVGDWWQVAGDPDLGALTTPGQQPVDFGVWQASDGTWQLWSCIRGTKEPGNTRLFYRWEGKSLTDPDWAPQGIAMHADTSLGETAGGLQAPFVMKTAGTYEMFYGDWEHICRQTSTDGKTFTRVIGPDGKTGMFGEGAGANTRDPMVLPIGDTYHAYYTASPGGLGADYVRTSKDLATWSAPAKIASGGSAGTGFSSAECPFVVYRPDEKVYFLFRTQRYGAMAQTSVYRSDDPAKFGVDDDTYFVETLPVAAPEIFEQGGQWFIAALLPTLKGIHISHLDWTPSP